MAENKPVESDSCTSISLLARLRQEPSDPKGWDEFVSRYRPRIQQWCKRWGLQESDADDVSQNVMLELSQQLKKFEYDPSGRFRAWLKTVARRAWYDYSQRRKKIEFQAKDSREWQQLASDDAQDDLLARLEEECNRELLQFAMQRVKSRVQENSWTAFELTEFQGLSAEQAGQQLEMNKGAVYVARARIQKMLLAEVEILDKIPDD